MRPTCVETEACLVDAVDGRLDAQAAMRVHAHIEGCVECRQRSELWQALVPGMRALVPSPPADLQARRLQIEIARRVQTPIVATPRLPRHRLWAGGGLGLACVAALLSLWLHTRAVHRKSEIVTPGVVLGFAKVTRVEGGVTSRGTKVAPSSVLPVGGDIEVASGGEAELLLDRGSHLRLLGPARLQLVGSAHDVEVRLASGTIQADVAHRLADETFAVITRDARVEVRGTRFVVSVGSGGSWVRVDEGLVRVHFVDGRQRWVAAGEVAGSESPPQNAETDDSPRASGGPAPSCDAVVRSCQRAARRVRETMRRGDHDHALAMIAVARRSATEIGGSCGVAISACEDELGYLGAETLRGAGRIGDSVRAFKSLNRAGAPAAMRQNALYAAAELERTQGHAAEARVDYERALAAAPRGALREEALVGSMESATLIGDHARSKALARRYLVEFPSGRSAVRARRILGEAAAIPGGDQR